MCTVRDIEASNSKLDVFIKPSPQSLGSTQKKGHKDCKHQRWWRHQENSPLRHTEKINAHINSETGSTPKNWTNQTEIPAQRRGTEHKVTSLARKLSGADTCWKRVNQFSSMEWVWLGKSITLQSRPYAQELLSNTRQTLWLFVHFVFCFALFVIIFFFFLDFDFV